MPSSRKDSGWVDTGPSYPSGRLAAAFSTTVIAGAGDVLPLRPGQAHRRLTFSIGLILVVLGGAKLFTGNNLIAVARASRHITSVAVLCNWTIVWIGNLVGSLATAVLIVVAGQYGFGGAVAAFVAMGFEHSVAYMYFIPAAILIKLVAPESFWTDIDGSAEAYAALDIAGFVGNLTPVTLGNIVGGTIPVGAVYWLAHLRDIR